MKITALRSLAKINSNVLQNSGRLFSFKFEMTAANRPSLEHQEEAKAVPEEQPKTPPASFRYNVCQPRTTSIEKPTMAGDMSTTQKQSIRAAIEEQHLQPSMLPEYFQRQMEKSPLVNTETDASEGDRIHKGHMHNQRFQMSKTCSNATLPLKTVKLANPFPEPVKMMMSRTVSDEEKAEQMLAESRSQRQLSDLNNKNYRTFATSVRRWFSSSSKDKSSGGSTVSTDSEKCKKKAPPKSTKATCPKMNMKGCAKARATCDRVPKDLNCKKQEAPYPAYSEFCHEDLIEKPSECKLCPWRPEDNPHFKPQKKKFHTSSMTSVRRSGLEMEYQEEVEPTMEEAVEEDVVEANPEGMQCDLRKPECERPKNRRCPQPKPEEKKKKEEAKKKKKGEVKKQKEEKPKKKLYSRILEGELLADALSPELSLKTHKGDKGKPEGACKIKKFKFPSCDKKGKKQKKEVVVDDGSCPKKKKPPGIRDCPPSEGGDERKCSAIEEIMEFSLSHGGKVDKDKKKCPKVDLNVLKEEKKEEEDPCALKRKGTTKICPGDLLKKRNRHPKKKTSGIMTPVESKTDMPQPRRTI